MRMKKLRREMCEWAARKEAAILETNGWQEQNVRPVYDETGHVPHSWKAKLWDLVQ